MSSLTTPPLPLIDRRVVAGHQAADVDNSSITLLGVSAAV